MAIEIGEKNISSIQRSLLQDASHDISPMHLANILHDVATDDDITDGDEELHPDWTSIYNLHKAQLDRIGRAFGQNRIGDIHRFFGGLRPIDPNIRKINPETEQIAFLLGAGASQPIPSDIPTVAELLPELLRRARRLDQDQLTSLANFCVEQEINDIEDLLTAVQISAFCTRNPSILRLVEFQLFRRHDADRQAGRAFRSPVHTDVSSVAYLQDTLQLLFGLLSNLMLPAEPNDGHKAIVKYLQENPSTPIITTNYDCCMDRALLNERLPFSYTVEFTNPEILKNSSDAVTSLIKLHGSLNWFYCETCQKVSVIDIERTFDDYNQQRGEYPIISVCIECGGQRRGLLVPPHAMKFDVAPPLQPLIATADSCFQDSTLIVVVGFSFADADLYISRMLIKAMQDSDVTRMAIIDPDDQIVEKVRRKFGAQIPDFDSANRILKLRGNCADLLPRFLSGQLLETAEEPEEQKEPSRQHLTVPVTS